MSIDSLWRVPVRIENIPEGGAPFALEADAAARAGVAAAVGLDGLPRLQAKFDVRRRGRDGLQVVGTISATVQQSCVVTLEPLTNEIREEVNLIFAPEPAALSSDALADAPEPPDPLIDGTVNLGAVAVEALLLGIDPFPRKPGAAFAAPASEEPDASPFAALTALKKSEPQGS